MTGVFLYAYVDSSVQTEDNIGMSTTPRLAVRCRDNRTEAFIVWDNYLDGNSGGYDDDRHIVTLRLPPNDPWNERMNVSTDNDSTFLRNAVRFIKRLVGHDRLVARTTPFNESPQTALFNVSGTREALTPLATMCGWEFDN